MTEKKVMFIFLGVVFLLGISLFFLGMNLTGNVIIWDNISYIAINNCSDLQNISSNLAGKYYLNQSIDCSSFSDFKPIGNYSNKFTGNFTGNGYSISDLTISGSTYIGIFGQVNGGYISNVTLNNITVSGTENVGILVAYVMGNSVVDYINIINSNVTGSKYIGGLIGNYDSSGIITNINVTNTIISISNQRSCGGLIGMMSSGSIKNSFFSGGNISINSSNETGGLVGYFSSNGNISNSYFNSSIINLSGSNIYVGGLIGRYNSLISSYITRSNSSGFINGTNYVGGLVGNVDGVLNIINSSSSSVIRGTNYIGGLVGSFGTSSSINSSYFNSSIYSKDYSGGLIGYNFGKLWNSYSLGSIFSDNYTGGLVGYNYNNAEIYYSYSNMIVNGTNYTGGLVGLNDNATIWHSFFSGNKTIHGDGPFYNASIIGFFNNTDITKIENLYFLNGSSSTNGGICYYNSSGTAVEKGVRCFARDNYTTFYYNNSIEPMSSWVSNVWTNIYTGVKLPMFLWQAQCLDNNHCSSSLSCYNLFCINARPNVSMSENSPVEGENKVISNINTDIVVNINSPKFQIFKMKWGDSTLHNCTFDGGYCADIFNNRINYNENLLIGLSFDNSSSLANNFLTGVDIGTPSGVTWSSNGRYGGSCYFNGEMKDVSILEPLNLTEFTISFWLKPINITDNSDVVLIRKNNNILDFEVNLKKHSDDIFYIEYNTNFSSDLKNVTLNISNNSWNFVAIRYNQTNISLSVNDNIGISTNTSSSTLRIDSVSNNIFKIGNEDLTNSYIDEFRIYNISLSEEELERLYFMGFNKTDDSHWTYNFSRFLQPGSYSYQFYAYDDRGNYNNTLLTSFSISSFSGGNGSLLNPYVITDCNSLNEISKSLNASYVLGNDTNCSGHSVLPIGNSTHGFNGSFNGSGHKIYGLNISGESYTGLFGYLNSSAVITDIIIENSTFNGSNYTGCIAGYSKNGTLISNVVCFDSNVSGENYVGGLVGYSSSRIFESGVKSIKVSGNSNYTGGLVGLNNYIINKSYVFGNISSSGRYLGGISGGNLFSLSNSYFNGLIISANLDIGGLVGVNNGNISNCYSFSEIISVSDDNTNIGGLIGINNGNLIKSFSVENSSSSFVSSFIGGLIGNNSGKIQNSFWYNKTDGPFSNAYMNSTGQIGNQNSTNITDINYFYNYSNAPMNYSKSDGWDFTNIWNIAFNYESTPSLDSENGCLLSSHCRSYESCINFVCVNTLPILTFETGTTAEGTSLNLSNANLNILISSLSLKFENISFSISEFSQSCNLYGYCTPFFNPLVRFSNTIYNNLTFGLSFNGESDFSNIINNSFSGTNNNSVYISSGKYDGARGFNGINSSINFSEIDLFSLNDFSISAWVKWTNGSNLSIISEEDGSDSLLWGLMINESGNLIFFNQSDNSFSSEVNVINNKWNLVGISYNGSSNNLTFYINGNNDSVFNFEKGINSPTKMFIGKTGDSFANGSIDEILIFNESMNNSEMFSLFYSGFNNILDNKYYINLGNSVINSTNIKDGSQNFIFQSCNDNGGCNSVSRNFIIETLKSYSAPSGGGSSGGGSGSGTSDETEDVVGVGYPINSTELSNGKSFSLKVRDYIYFTIASKTYKFIVNDFSSNYIELRIPNNSLNNIAQSKTVSYNLDNDSYYDISIKYLNSNSTYANIHIKANSSLIVQGGSTPDNNPGISDDDDDNDDDSLGSAIIPENPDNNGNNNSIFIIIGIVLGVIFFTIIIIIIISLKKKKLENERKKNGQQFPNKSNANFGNSKMNNINNNSNVSSFSPQRNSFPINQMNSNIRQGNPIPNNVNNSSVRFNNLKPDDIGLSREINALLMSGNAKLNQGDMNGAKFLYKQINDKYNLLSKHDDILYKKILDFVNRIKSNK